MEIKDNILYLGGLNTEALIQEYGSPLYIYEEEVIRSQYRQLSSGFDGELSRIHYAMKANGNPAILRILLEEGANIDAVSPFEVQLALETGFLPEQVLFTGDNVSKDELRYCLQQKVNLNVGALPSLQKYGELNPGGKVSVRINPGLGAGHHANCITGGPQSKFGIYYDQIEELFSIAKKYNLTINGVHSHIGTGIFEPAPMLAAMDLLISVARQFQDLEFIDFGGGFGVPYRPEQQALDVKSLGEQMTERFLEFRKSYSNEIHMKIEPGRFLVASSGTLFAHVTSLKHTSQYQFVGINTGFQHLIRPTLYGSYHHVVNASGVQGQEEPKVIAGNICENGDFFTANTEGIAERMLPPCKVGDVLAVCDAGAYGFSMSSQYNMRPRPAEVLISEGKPKLIRRREVFEDLTRLCC